MSFDHIDFDRLREQIDGIIMKNMPAATGPAAKVRQAMNYAISTGGKRVRPMLMLLTFRALGGEGNVVEPFMAAIEMIHTHSLIHDDLPALDNDSLRHGKPSVHVKFGEDMAVLAGDALLNLAYETAARAFMLRPGDQKVERAFSLLAAKSGISGMLGGQSADVAFTGKAPDEKTLRYIYEKKTAALIECPMMIGAILAGAGDDVISDIRQAGRELGLAFQVRDDILDATGTPEELGKEAGQDARNSKTTYVSLHGVEEAERYVTKKTDHVILILSDVLDEDRNEAAKLLKQYALILAGRKK